MLTLPILTYMLLLGANVRNHWSLKVSNGRKIDGNVGLNFPSKSCSKFEFLFEPILFIVRELGSRKVKTPSTTYGGERILFNVDKCNGPRILPVYCCKIVDIASSETRMLDLRKSYVLILFLDEHATLIYCMELFN